MLCHAWFTPADLGVRFPAPPVREAFAGGGLGTLARCRPGVCMPDGGANSEL